MRTRGTRPILGMLLIVTVLGGGAAPAAGETLLFSPGGAIALRGLVTVESEAGSFACAMTLTGSLTSTAVEVAPGTTVGSLDEAVNECEGTTVRFLRRGLLRLARVLSGASGVLVTLEEAGVLVGQERPSPRFCLYGSRLAFLIGTEEVTLLREALPLQRTLEGTRTPCPFRTTLSGRMAMTPRQAIVVR